jgi:MoxR-like ATPase
MLEAIEELKSKLGENGYLTDDNLASALYLAEKLEKPLLLEGPAGVGKTELAKAWSRLRNRRLVHPNYCPDRKRLGNWAQTNF